MKKMMFMVVLMVIAIDVTSQARLGSTYKEIKDEFENSSDDVLTEKYVSDPAEGMYYKYIEVKIDNALVGYFFTTSLICYLTIIVPDHDGALNYYVEYYNKHYVIISPTKWRMYNRNGYCDINLKYDDDGSYHFTWTNGQ
ncbi:MAG: hypothetical protein JXR34_13830 [Bacteroidales bacterium]|nr:hypothetical protein [Bacteroidales bacterium]